MTKISLTILSSTLKQQPVYICRSPLKNRERTFCMQAIKQQYQVSNRIQNCLHLFLRTYSQCFFLWLRHHSNPRWLVEYEVWWKESVRIRSVVCCSPITHYPLCCTYQCLPSGHSQRIDGLCIGKWKLIDLTCSSHKCWLITVWR